MVLDFHRSIEKKLLDTSFPWFLEDGRTLTNRRPKMHVQRRLKSMLAMASAEKLVTLFLIDFQTQFYEGLCCPRRYSNMWVVLPPAFVYIFKCDGCEMVGGHADVQMKINYGRRRSFGTLFLHCK